MPVKSVRIGWMMNGRPLAIDPPQAEGARLGNIDCSCKCSVNLMILNMRVQALFNHFKHVLDFEIW